MKFKDKVISNLDSIANQMGSLKNLVENNNIGQEQLKNEMQRLINRIEGVSEMVGLEDNDFAVLRQGINS